MLNKLKEKFVHFMYGRYGMDELYQASIITFIALRLLQIFVHSPFLNVITFVLIIWIAFRVLSKNILARRKEKQFFLNFASLIKSKGRMFIRRMKDLDSHRYRKCFECKTILRLPKKRGTHKVRCPKCDHLLKVKIWF